jgi:hypothetical protein
VNKFYAESYELFTIFSSISSLDDDDDDDDDVKPQGISHSRRVLSIGADFSAFPVSTHVSSAGRSIFVH